MRLATVGIGTQNEFSATARCEHEMFVGGITLFFEDPEAPTIEAVSGPSGPVASAPTPVRVTAGDPGFGVSTFVVQAKGSDGQTKTWSTSVQPGCTGLREFECPHGAERSVTVEPSLLPEGNDTLTITARDPGGRESSRTLAITVDRTPPDTLIDSGPANEHGIAGTTTTFTYHSTQSGSSFECKVDAGAFASCSPSGFTTATLASGTHTFSVRATDGAGNTDASPASRTFFVGPPDTVIDSGPPALTTNRDVVITFHSTQPNSTFSCTFDNRPENCSSGSFKIQGVSSEFHTFRVTASSSAGVADPTPAQRGFRVDSEPPETTIKSGPSGLTSNPTPDFTYSAIGEQQPHFECSLDAAPFENCPKERFATETRLPDGPHSFAVRAVDPAGNMDQSPATRSFTVDTAPPSVRIETGPSGLTGNSTPTFTFSASNDATVACSIEGEGSSLEEPSLAACTTPSSHTAASPLADGRYTFLVRATDGAGNEAGDSRSFVVDTTPPDTTITAGPSNATIDDPKPTFAFSSSESGSTFRCRFDSEPFAPCSGPRATDTPDTALADGLHSFEVRATDGAGNADPTPAAAAFTVDGSAPQTTITAGPQGAIAQTDASFEYSADEPATFQCRLDGTGFTACPVAGDNLPGLAEGEHRFEVRAVGAGGALDPTPAVRNFIVDTSPPSLPAVSGPVREDGVPGLSLHLEVKDGDPSTAQSKRSGVGAIRITVDGGFSEALSARCTLNVCPGTAVREFQLPAAQVIGSHRYVVEAEDGVGHFSPLASWEKTTPEAGTLYPDRASGPSDCLAHPKPLEKLPVAGVLTGTNGSDLIKGRPGVKTIRGEGGCDVILGGPEAEAIEAGPGNDLIRGGRSDDTIFGGEGDDLIYGGIGDDPLQGGPGNDLLDGGPGADVEKGEGGDDTLRGGQGEDQLAGEKGTDTLSYADLIPPGFGKAEGPVAGFPGFPGEEAGVIVKLNATKPFALDAPGTGGDALFIDRERSEKPSQGQVGTPGDFERIVGSPFNDLIERSLGSQQVLAGPGSDVILGGGRENIDGGPGDNFLEGDATRQMGPPRPAGKIELGLQGEGDEGRERNLFLAGTSGEDDIGVKYLQAANTIQYRARSETAAKSVVARGCKPRPEAQLTVNCPLGSAKLGAVVLFGAGGNDKLAIEGDTRERSGAFALGGGPGADTLTGGTLEELLVDGAEQGSGTEKLHGGGGDDAIFQGSGADEIQGDTGSDLLVSSRICEGDELYGDGREDKDLGADNAQFHPVVGPGVFADLSGGKLGEAQAANHVCSNEAKRETLLDVNDLEGSAQPDVFLGTDRHNLLIGRGGANSLFGRNGNDVLNSKNAIKDEAVNCGGGADVAHVERKDKEAKGVVAPNCEKVNGGGDAHTSGVLPDAEEESAPPVLGQVAEPPPPPAVTAYLPLDDREGTTAASGLEEGIDGSYEAAGLGPSVNGPGPVLGAPTALLSEEGSAIGLDGSGDYVNLAGQGYPGGGNPYSVELFVKFSRPPGQREYLFASAEGGEGAFLYRDPAGRIVFATGAEPGAPQVSSAEAIKDERWHLIVGSLEGRTLTLNVDGFPYRLNYGESVVPEEAASPQSLLGSGPGLTGFLAGTLDEFAAFEGTLSESEIFVQLAQSQAEEPELLLTPAPETSDVDGDGIPDGVDNCPEVSNSDQADLDMNGIGDACEPPDADGDGVPDASDNCPATYNPEQTDANGDGIGNECTQLPPTVATEAASGVKGSVATLNGSVNPDAVATTYQFEYGTTAAYGASVPLAPESVGSGASAIALSKAIGGLQPGTTYHYRIVATSAAGETEGADETFTTLKPPTAQTQGASAVKATTATLNAAVDPEGSETTYQFEYGTTTAYGSVAPASPKSIGSGNANFPAAETIGGLQPNTTYHDRVVASNEAGTVAGKDAVFTTEPLPITGAQLNAMALSEPFNGSPSSTANFASNFTKLGWAAERGEDSISGWRPVGAFPTVNGASYSPTLADAGSGVAAEATLAETPSNPERYFSLWLDMTSPSAGTRTGYELRFTDTSTNTYTVNLDKWQAGALTVLASRPGVVFSKGSALAIVDQGATVSAWTNSNSGFSQLLSVSDGTFSGGNAGLEGAGNITRLTNFKAGVPLSPVANMDAALRSLPLNDAFATTESPLSGGGAWAALAWDNSTSGTNTGRVENGWGPSNAFPTVNGAFWQRTGFADTGSGDAVATTLTHNATIAERYVSLWLDMPAPASTRSGYELRFTETGTNVYEVALSKWLAGAKTLLASRSGVSLPTGSQLALSEKAGTVAAWTSTGGEFTQLLSAPDATFVNGFTGVEGAGNISRLTNFRSGLLPPF